MESEENNEFVVFLRVRFTVLDFKAARAPYVWTLNVIVVPTSLCNA